MRTNILSVVLAVAAISVVGWVAGADTKTEGQGTEALSLEGATVGPDAAKTGETRLARVTEWIRERVPGCPPEIMVSIAQGFLEDLQESNPDQLDRLLAPDFPVREVEPALLRQAAGHLKGPKWADLREEFSRRRIEAALMQEGLTPKAAAADAAALMAKIKNASQIQHRRLLEGRIEDDELTRLLNTVRGGDSVHPKATQVEPKALTAAEIVSDFARHNQVGGALQRLRAYTIEAKLKPAVGEEQHLMLFKMRPDRFRLAVLVDGDTRLIVAGDGTRFWQQAPGGTPQIIVAEKMGTKRYLGEFIDPLFAEEGFSYERLADGSSGGRKLYRIAVRRSDGSSFVAQIDMDSFRQVGREDTDGSNTAYSDFRQVAGLTVAFREEATDREGRKGVLELVRMSPNPGLIQDFFEPALQGGQSYFSVERLLARPPLAAATSKQPAQ
jgi:hypothetical protein